MSHGPQLGRVPRESEGVHLVERRKASSRETTKRKEKKERISYISTTGEETDEAIYLENAFLAIELKAVTLHALNKEGEVEDGSDVSSLPSVRRANFESVRESGRGGLEIEGSSGEEDGVKRTDDELGFVVQREVGVVSVSC